MANEANQCDRNYGLSHLTQNIKRTKHNKYRAAFRLRREHSDLTLIIALSSTIVIALSLAPLLLPDIFTNDDELKISFLTIFTSIVIIVLTLIQESKNRMVNAHILKMCADELVVLYGSARIMAEDGANSENVEQLQTKYYNLLTKYNADHDDVDYLDYKIYHPDDFITAGDRLRWLKIIRWKAKISFRLSTYRMYFGVFVLALAVSLYLLATN